MTPLIVTDTTGRRPILVTGGAGGARMEVQAELQNRGHTLQPEGEYGIGRRRLRAGRYVLTLPAPGRQDLLRRRLSLR